MRPEEPRTAARRKADTLAKLRADVVDVWVATADAPAGSARPYLVPLSLAWVDDRVVIASPAGSRTSRNIRESGSARLGLGPTRDVVLIDAVLEDAVEVGAAPASLAEGYAAQTDWDPRTEPSAYVFLVLRPDRIQAWRESNELPGRTLMRDGAWLV